MGGGPNPPWRGWPHALGCVAEAVPELPFLLGGTARRRSHPVAHTHTHTHTHTRRPAPPAPPPAQADAVPEFHLWGGFGRGKVAAELARLLGDEALRRQQVGAFLCGFSSCTKRLCDGWL